VRFVKFILTVTLSVASVTAVLLALHSSSLSSAVLRDPDRRWILDQLPAGELAFVKMSYANEAGRFDVGLFGNSRIVMVGTESMSLPGARIFNFGVPGQSIRQSVRLIGELRAIDKLPATIVIAMDHVELGLPGGDGVFPSAIRRWWMIGVEAWKLSRSIGWRATLVQIHNAVSNERHMAAVAFNPVYIFNKLKALTAIKGQNAAYRLDGSRDEGERGEFSAAQIEIPRRADRYPQLEYDLETLGALRREGFRVIIFESPLVPSLLGRIELALSEHAQNVRQRLRVACDSLKIECYGPPLLTGPGWVERDHAPASLLGTWLEKIIRSGA
jgi:hypothetical protein